MTQTSASLNSTAGSDRDLVQRAGGGDERAFEALMRRYNGRLFRVARAMLKDDADAEEVLQDAYLQAFRALPEFRGDASLSTWLTRIVINQSLMRMRRLKRDRVVVRFGDAMSAHEEVPDVPDERAESAPAALLRSEMRRLLERRIDQLPAAFRAVFILREVEGLSVEEAAECLSIPPATVRTRLFRARALLREALAREIDDVTTDVFAFAGERCDRIVAGVLARIRQD